MMNLGIYRRVQYDLIGSPALRIHEPNVEMVEMPEYHVLMILPRGANERENFQPIKRAAMKYIKPFWWKNEYNATGRLISYYLFPFDTEEEAIMFRLLCD